MLVDTVHVRTRPLSIIFLLLLPLFGCLSEPAGQDRSPQVTLRVIGEGYPPLLALEKVKGDYERQTGVRVEITKRDHMAVVAEMDREFTSGNVTYDLVLMPHRLLGKLVEKKHVQPIDEFLSNPAVFDKSKFAPETDLFPGWWHEVAWYGDKPYGFPFMALSMYLWYRQDLFESPDERAAFEHRYGHPLQPPTTWQQYEEIAAFFHRPDKGLFGTSIQGQRHVALWYEWLAYAYGFHANILNSRTGSAYADIVVNSPAARAATEFYLRMLNYSSPEAVNYNWDDALSSFQQGRTALAIMWHDSAPWVEDSKESKVAGKVGYAPPPSIDGIPAVHLEAHTLLIPVKAPHSVEAFKFMAWILTHDAQVAQTLAGGMSPRLSTYDDARVRALPYMREFPRIVKHSVPKPTIPESDQITEIMTLGLSRIVAKTVDSKAGLDQMATDIAKVLGPKAHLPNSVAK